MNDISFTSRINFVNNKTIDRFMKGAYVDFRVNAIPEEKLALEILGETKRPRIDVLKSDEFYTDTVRTCTAGGVINTKTGEAVGFHIYDNLVNLESTDEILKDIFAKISNPDRALILGSKKLKASIYSVPIFQKIYEGITKRVPNVTVFREHTLPYSETNMHYCAKTDTWTIQSMYKPLTDYKEYDILSKEELDKCFKEVKLANGDVLTFEKPQ